mmetsp:Transcript_9130/g.19778  ORF Transcript_9130/g.19778 Transcript_9130/m.19778 type:complete len:177 (-) Transcript_9130:231-761(-)
MEFFFGDIDPGGLSNSEGSTPAGPRDRICAQPTRFPVAASSATTKFLWEIPNGFMSSFAMVKAIIGSSSDLPQRNRTAAPEEYPSLPFCADNKDDENDVLDDARRCNGCGESTRGGGPLLPRWKVAHNPSENLVDKSRRHPTLASIATERSIISSSGCDDDEDIMCVQMSFMCYRN